MNSKLGIVFRQYRKLKGYSQEYVALELGISQKAYSKVENDQTELSWARILKISEILEVNPLDVIDNEVDMTKQRMRNEAKKEVFVENLMSIYENRISKLERELRDLQGKNKRRT